MIEALGDRLKVFSDIVKLGRYFFTETLTSTPTRSRSGSARKASPRPGRARRGAGEVEPYDVATLEQAIHAYAETHGHPMGQVVNPLRVATTGQGVGPGCTIAW